jgi:hypothetical protein
MECVVVERRFAEPVSFAELDASERMLCLYQTPAAEAVRQTQRQAGLPFERARTASVFEPR